MSTTARGVAKIRIIAEDPEVENLATAIEQIVVAEGYEIIERTVPLGMRYPEDEKSRVFMTIRRDN